MATVCQQAAPYGQQSNGKRTRCGALAAVCEPDNFTMCNVHAKLAGFRRCAAPDCLVWIKGSEPLCSACGTRAALAHG